jgi:hypothetical protein
MATAAPTGECDDRPVTQEMTGWLRQCLDRDRNRLLNTARDAAGTPGGSVVTRLAMDQVSGIASTLKVIDCRRSPNSVLSREPWWVAGHRGVSWVGGSGGGGGRTSRGRTSVVSAFLKLRGITRWAEPLVEGVTGRQRTG